MRKSSRVARANLSPSFPNLSFQSHNLHHPRATIGYDGQGGGVLSLPRADPARRPAAAAAATREVLAEDALPRVEPLLLLGREELPGHAERAREHVAQPRPQVLDGEQRLPVGHAEARAVAVEDYYAGVHVDAHVAAEEGDGEVLDGRGLVGVEEPAMSR